MIIVETDREKELFLEDWNTKQSIVIPIWEDLETIFGLEYDEIKRILTKWVEEAYNIKGITPRAVMDFTYVLVE